MNWTPTIAHDLMCQYYDGCSNAELAEMIGSSKELDRLNLHRGTTWTQKQLDDILAEALRLRIEDGQK